ncbi:hypothetical protein F1559_005168 [Cyanidiococcus yangmingshanensis]|uniref:Uncharacterized protein n=1 Tax=Cyanidiococcus yangmingshanensis TaxID=2690220 RepID=A0A7J7IH60_9RHOD|nr:hypothetical protein F1559_005168 [Cyanidiococcus yangmingshanensis]
MAAAYPCIYSSLASCASWSTRRTYRFWLGRFLHFVFYFIIYFFAIAQSRILVVIVIVGGFSFGVGFGVGSAQLSRLQVGLRRRSPVPPVPVVRLVRSVTVERNGRGSRASYYLTGSGRFVS